MKNIKTSIYIILTTLLLSHGKAFSQHTAEWTVMVFLNADNNLEADGLKDFLEMSSVPDNAAVNIVVQMDRWDGIGPGSSTAYGDWSTTTRFKMKNGLKPLLANGTDVGEQNMGDPQVLSNFVQWSMQKYPAKKYMLVLWDHGDGWRLLAAEQAKILNDSLALAVFQNYKIKNEILDHYTSNYLKSQPANKAFYTKKYAHTFINPDEKITATNFFAEYIDKGHAISVEDLFLLTKNDTVNNMPANAVSALEPHRGISHDDKSRDKLYNREIQDALQNLLGQNKLNVIGFDACLMSMVETAYALRKVATVMVGSEEVEPGTGWDYSKWLGKLVSNPTINETELGKIMVSSYKDTYPYDEVTLSATNISNSENLAASISQLSEKLITVLPTETTNLQKARTLCRAYTYEYGFFGIDIKTFLLQYKKTCQIPEVITLIDNVIAQINTMVISYYATPERAYIENLPSYGSFGFAIYFPESGSLYNNDPRAEHGYEENNLLYPVEFVQNHKWDNFLKEYFKHVPN